MSLRWVLPVLIGALSLFGTAASSHHPVTEPARTEIGFLREASVKHVRFRTISERRTHSFSSLIEIHFSRKTHVAVLNHSDFTAKPHKALSLKYLPRADVNSASAENLIG